MRFKKYILILGVALLSAALLGIVFVHSAAIYAQANAAGIQKKIEEAIRLRDKEKDISRAMKLFKEVLAEQPNNVGVLVFLAEMYMNSGDLDSALKSVDSALSVTPSNSFALRVKGDLLIKQSKYKEAEEVLNKAIASSTPKSSDHALAYFGLTKLYLKQGEKAKAKASLEKALEDDPNNTFFKQQMKVVESPDVK